MIKDSTDKTPIIICELLIEEMSKESCYNMTNMRVQRYLDERILKTTLISEVSLNDDIEVTANDDIVYILFTNETKIVAKVVTADLKALAQTYLCSICNMSFSIENELGWCIDCNNVSFTTSKVFEKLVNNRIVDHLEKRVLSSDFKHGFSSFRSTTDLLTVVSDRIARAFISRSGATQAVARDLLEVLTWFGMLVFFTNLSLMAFQVRHLTLFLLFSLTDGLG